MSKDTFIGIDPGKTGGLAVIYPDQSWDAVAMPKTVKGIFEWLDMVATEHGYRTRAYIEKVHSMPGQGVKSMFTFGENYGMLQMALTASRFSYEYVTPRTWQKSLGVVARKPNETKTQFKTRLLNKAEQLFPYDKITKSTCDALLIAEYGRRLNSVT